MMWIIIYIHYFCFAELSFSSMATSWRCSPDWSLQKHKRRCDKDDWGQIAAALEIVRHCGRKGLDGMDGEEVGRDGRAGVSDEKEESSAAHGILGSYHWASRSVGMVPRDG